MKSLEKIKLEIKHKSKLTKIEKSQISRLHYEMAWVMHDRFWSMDNYVVLAKLNNKTVGCGSIWHYGNAPQRRCRFTVCVNRKYYYHKIGSKIYNKSKKSFGKFR